MSYELAELEIMLRNMRPIPLKTDLLERVEDRISGIHAPEDRVECLENLAPTALPEVLAIRLEQILSSVPHPNSQKLIPFPDSPEQPVRSTPWKRFAAVAAVAMCGSLAALLIPADPPGASMVSARHTSTSSGRIDFASFIPASQQTGLAAASDQGIIWTNDRRPQRMLKLVYRDHLTLRDDKGHECQVEAPRVEYLMVPAKVD